MVAGPGHGQDGGHHPAHRVAHRHQARPATQILALTFTDKAAAEMQARVDLLVPYGQADSAILTFHAFGDQCAARVRT